MIYQQYWSSDNAMNKDNVYERAYAAIMACYSQDKVNLTRQLCEDWAGDRLSSENLPTVKTIEQPGLPDSLVLVSPAKLEKRGLSSAKGKAIFVHAIAHIEFNAINLALDAVYRFQEMPDQYISDWLQVAADEARHFCLLADYLAELGWEYGDFSAHNGLWELTVKSAHDLGCRMALIPRVMEARGLDVTPGMIRKFEGLGDQRMVSILQLILDEEVDHVKKGDHWFRWVCAREQRNPEAYFMTLVEDYLPGVLKGPFNIEARLQAGFSKQELEQFGAAWL